MVSPRSCTGTESACGHTDPVSIAIAPGKLFRLPVHSANGTPKGTFEVANTPCGVEGQCSCAQYPRHPMFSFHFGLVILRPHPLSTRSQQNKRGLLRERDFSSMPHARIPRAVAALKIKTNRGGGGDSCSKGWGCVISPNKEALHSKFCGQILSIHEPIL